MGSAKIKKYGPAQQTWYYDLCNVDYIVELPWLISFVCSLIYSSPFGLTDLRPALYFNHVTWIASKSLNQIVSLVLHDELMRLRLNIPSGASRALSIYRNNLDRSWRTAMFWQIIRWTVASLTTGARLFWLIKFH